MTHRKLIFLGAVHAAFAVAMGAIASHVMRNRLTPHDFTVFEIGARYHMYGGLGTVVMALALERGIASKLPAYLLQAGILLFAGSLYLLPITGLRAFGALTPFGGTFFMLAWLWLAKDAWLGVRSTPPPAPTSPATPL